MDNNIIKDPYYRFNDVDYRWIANDNWTYTSDFTGNSIYPSIKGQIMFIIDNVMWYKLFGITNIRSQLSVHLSYFKGYRFNSDIGKGNCEFLEAAL